MLELVTKGRDIYTLDDEGYVVARSNGPEGWNYGRGWRIVGFKTRHNAHRTISLQEALDGADVGQGWIVDWDHGTFRLWGSPSADKLASIRRIPTRS
jgi:hypothetical protein